MCSNPQETGYLVRFTEESLSGKLHFFVQCNYGQVLSNLTRIKPILYLY